jgi:hypothetical protein
MHPQLVWFYIYHVSAHASLQLVLHEPHVWDGSEIFALNVLHRVLLVVLQRWTLVCTFALLFHDATLQQLLPVCWYRKLV